ncbi:hypothetical protein [Pricia sp.]|uniref:hypothetical protein n=1 Tax=Pricia sp. TaxID=2268138 RepID=UPI003592F1DA
MGFKSWKSKYAVLIWTIVLLPNIFAIYFGVASFPYTCAPMFAHQINEDSKLCVFKFEGSNACKTVDLEDNYGRSETFFIRYFFSKVYGSSESVSPFARRLSENKAAFQHRMNDFFEGYAAFLDKEKQLPLDKIILKVKQVDASRQDIAPCEILGFYDVKLKKYISAYENPKNQF